MRYANPPLRFSGTEVRDLIRAWVLTSVAFAIFFIRTGFIPADGLTWNGFVIVFFVALLTAGVGFIVHELCHKIAAHHFRVQGEFVANGTMLFVSIFFAFMGFLFAAPGAVHILGHISKRENGIISAAGPASNMVLTLVFLPLALLPVGPFLQLIGVFGVWINAILGAFNLIPFLGLDGSKILAWHKIVYGVMVGIAGIQVAGVFIFF